MSTMKPTMVYDVHLIALLVFCATIVTSLPVAEEEVRQRVHRDSNWPANQYANQPYQRSRYAQPQTVDSVGNTHQQPNNQAYRQRKGYDGNKRLREQPVFHQVAENNEPLSGVVNDKQVYDYRYQNRPENKLGANSAVDKVANNRLFLSNVEEPNRQTEQYEHPKVISERYPINLRNQYYHQQPFYGVQRPPQTPNADFLKNVRRVEVSEPQHPDEVIKFASPRANPGIVKDQVSLNTKTNDYLVPNTKRYTIVHPNGTNEYVDKLEGITRKYENYVNVNGNDEIPNKSKFETIQRLLTPVKIPDTHKRIPMKPENESRDFTDKKAYQYNSRIPTLKTEYLNSQHSYQYDVPENRNIISEVRPYAKDTSIYNPQSLVETPAVTLTEIPRFIPSTNIDFSNTEISNDVPRQHLTDVQNRHFISSANSDIDYETIARGVITIPSIKTPTIQSTLLTEDNMNNPPIAYTNSGGSIVSYKDEIDAISPIEIKKKTQISSWDNNDNNPPIPSTNTDIANIPNVNEIITVSPIANFNNVPGSTLKTTNHNPSILSSITHISDVLYNNDGTKILAIENFNDASLSSQEKDKFHLNSETISSMDSYISNLAVDSEIITLSPIEIPIDEQPSDIQSQNTNMPMEHFIENISSERISRFSQDEDSSVAASVPKPIQNIFKNVLKDIIGTNESNQLVTENGKTKLEKDISSSVEEDFVNDTEFTSDEILNSFIENESYESLLERETNDIHNPLIESEKYSNFQSLYKSGNTEVLNTVNVGDSDDSNVATTTRISVIDIPNDGTISTQTKNTLHINRLPISSMGSYVSKFAKDDTISTISPIEILHDEYSSDIQKLNMNIPIETVIENVSSERNSRLSQHDNSFVVTSFPDPVPKVFGKDIIGKNEPNHLITDNIKTSMETDVSSHAEINTVQLNIARFDDIPNSFNENKINQSPLDRNADDILNPIIETESLSNLKSLQEIDITENLSPVIKDTSASEGNGNILYAPFKSENDEAIKLFTVPASNSDRLSLFEVSSTKNIPNSLATNELGDNTVTISHIEAPLEISSENLSAYSESNILYEPQCTGNKKIEIELEEMATATPVYTKVECTQVTDTNQPSVIDIVNERPDISEDWFKTHSEFWKKLSNGDINYDVFYLFQVYDQPVVEKSTKTTVYPNGIIVQEYSETTWESKDTKPIIVQSSRVVDSDKHTDGQIVAL